MVKLTQYFKKFILYPMKGNLYMSTNKKATSS